MFLCSVGALILSGHIRFYTCTVSAHEICNAYSSILNILSSAFCGPEPAKDFCNLSLARFSWLGFEVVGYGSALSFLLWDLLLSACRCAGLQSFASSSSHLIYSKALAKTSYIFRYERLVSFLYNSNWDSRPLCYYRSSDGYVIVAVSDVDIFPIEQCQVVL